MKQLDPSSQDDDLQLKNDSLKHVTVMNDEGLTLGLPSKIFAGGVTLSLTFTFLLQWYTGALFGMVYFMAMYAIHKDDPKALQGWMKAAFSKRKEVWSGGVYKGRKIYVIDNKD